MSPSGEGGGLTLLSFLGVIGDMMSGSGMEELLELIYGMNSVGHNMSGKAFAQTVRGHFLVDSCLNYILINKIVKKKKTVPRASKTLIVWNGCTTIVQKRQKIPVKSKKKVLIELLGLIELEQEKQR